MDIISAFGARVGSLAEENPARARSLLLAGLRANGLKTALFPGGMNRADRLLFRTLNDLMVRCLAHPAENAMVSLFTPCELLQITGLHPYSCEAFSGYLSGSRAEQYFLRAADEAGIPGSLCSYHKIFIGAAKSGLMPKPKLIVSTSLACDANMLTFRYLADFYQVPHFFLDVPFEQSEQAVDYVAGQLRQLGEFLERHTGRAVDENALRQAVRTGCDTLGAYDAFLSGRKGKQILSDLGSELFRTAIVHFLLGTPEAKACAEALLREPDNAPPARGQQLLWIHTTPYWVTPLRELFNRNPRVQITACDLNYENIGALDPEKPYDAMARRLVFSAFNGPAERRIERALDVARQTGANGAVWFCHWGCKHTLGGAQLGKKKFEENGLPTLLLDGDSCDRAFGGEGQAATRMEAFLEMLEAGTEEREVP